MYGHPNPNQSRPVMRRHNTPGYGDQSDAPNTRYNNNSSSTNVMQNHTLSRLDDPTLKDCVINIIYGLDIKKYKFHVLETDSITDHIDNHSYVSPNYNGQNYFMVCFMHNEYKYTVLVNRKTLCYSKYQVDINKVDMYKISYRVPLAFYAGTILDGVLVESHLKNNSSGANKKMSKPIFVITNVLILCGMNTERTEINDKLNHLCSQYGSDICISCIPNDEPLNDIYLERNTLYPIKHYDIFIKQIYQTLPLFPFGRGVSFYNAGSGIKFIYMAKNNAHHVQTRSINRDEADGPDIHNNVMKTNESVFSNISPTNSTAKFYVVIGNHPDTYYLYLTKSRTKHDTILKYIGCAYISDIDNSCICRNLFTDSRTHIMECKYIPNIKKWTPLCKRSGTPDEISVIYPENI